MKRQLYPLARVYGEMFKCEKDREYLRGVYIDTAALI